MSIKIMSRVWEHGPPDKSETLVLLAIADFCNDEGECWPSVASIARKARMTERGVQKIVARLVEIGWLKIDQNAGKRGCNLYLVITPEHGSPRTKFTPNAVRQPPNPVPKTPEPRSPEPSYNHQEPSVLSLALSAPERDAPDMFEEFWQQYPHRNGAKKGKDPARKAWARAIKARASPEQIIGGAMRYATDRQVIEGYAKDPATWLNQKGWEDDTEQHRANGPARPGPSRTGNAMVDAFAAVAAERIARNRGS